MREEVDLGRGSAQLLDEFLLIADHLLLPLVLLVISSQGGPALFVLRAHLCQHPAVEFEQPGLNRVSSCLEFLHLCDDCCLFRPAGLCQLPVESDIVVQFVFEFLVNLLDFDELMHPVLFPLLNEAFRAEVLLALHAQKSQLVRIPVQLAVTAAGVSLVDDLDFLVLLLCALEILDLVLIKNDVRLPQRLLRPCGSGLALPLYE